MKILPTPEDYRLGVAKGKFLITFLLYFISEGTRTIAGGNHGLDDIGIGLKLDIDLLSLSSLSFSVNRQMLLKLLN